MLGHGIGYISLISYTKTNLTIHLLNMTEFYLNYFLVYHKSFKISNSDIFFHFNFDTYLIKNPESKRYLLLFSPHLD